MRSCPIFFCDVLKEIVGIYIIQSRRSFCASPSCDLDFALVFNLDFFFTTTLNLLLCCSLINLSTG
jgi:hypothetical protein